MNRISVFVRRQRIKKLETWTMRAILVEAFFLALFPSVAAAAVVVGMIAWFFRVQIDSRFKLRSLPFDVPVIIFILFCTVSVFLSPARNFELIFWNSRLVCLDLHFNWSKYPHERTDDKSCEGVGTVSIFCRAVWLLSIHFRR